MLTIIGKLLILLDKIACEFGLDRRQISDLLLAGAIHYIGVISTSDRLEIVEKQSFKIDYGHAFNDANTIFISYISNGTVFFLLIIVKIVFA